MTSIMNKKYTAQLSPALLSMPRRHIVTRLVKWCIYVCMFSVAYANARGPIIDKNKEFMPLQWCLFQKRYSCVIQNAQLEKTPSWSEKDENPPLSARKAFAAAKEMLKTKCNLGDSKEIVWRPSTAKLILALKSRDDDNIWFWHVIFESQAVMGTISKPWRMEAIVLMDGTAIIPAIEDMAINDEYCRDWDEEANPGLLK